MKYILVCEDERAIREFIVINLRRNGYETLEAASGEEALTLYEEHSQDVLLALLDVMLPGIDGFTVCKKLREKSSALGIVMLTARTQESEKVGALKLGADDYITKPFGPSELIARVDALSRRISVSPKEQEQQTVSALTAGCFSIDLRNRLLLKKDVPIELTQVEFQMIQFFFENPDKPLKRLEILHHVWGKEYFGEEKVVDVNIRRLRMKIEDDPSEPHYIQTVWGCGYQWNSN